MSAVAHGGVVRARNERRRSACDGGQLSLEGTLTPVAPLRAPALAGAAAPAPGRTLDDVLVGAWEGLTAHHAVACLVCGGAMTPRHGATGAPAGGRCSGCGSTLS
jgi:hypothetical protein